MFLKMLYQHEKKVFKENKTRLEPFLCTTKLHINSFSLDGLRVQFKMYSWLCPWLLTWSDLEEHFNEEDEGGYDDAGAN
jgi:hypothetical protein